MDWKEALKQHYATHHTYTTNDFVEHFASETDQKDLERWYASNSHKPMRTFSGVSNDWQAFIAPSFQLAAIQYGLVGDLPQGLITNVPSTGDHARNRFMWKNEGIEDYVEGEPFKETYMEGATTIERWRKPGAKIVNTYEAIADVPLDTVTMNLGLSLNEFRAREWKHFTHELHKSTSNAFATKAADKNGNPLNITGWRAVFENAYDGVGTDKWADIKEGRQRMLRRSRDAVRPNVAILNATTEATLSESDKVNLAYIIGDGGTYWRTGALPNIYGLQFVVVPDALYGYFTNDVARKNNEFVKTDDICLLTTSNGPTIMRYTREPLTTETWRIQDGQKEALNVWERYNYGCYRFTNIMRVSYNHTNADGSTGKLV
jgi:hypothetical protein